MKGIANLHKESNKYEVICSRCGKHRIIRMKQHLAIPKKGGNVVCLVCAAIEQMAQVKRRRAVFIDRFKEILIIPLAKPCPKERESHQSFRKKELFLFYLWQNYQSCDKINIMKATKDDEVYSSKIITNDATVTLTYAQPGTIPRDCIVLTCPKCGANRILTYPQLQQILRGESPLCKYCNRRLKNSRIGGS